LPASNLLKITALGVRIDQLASAVGAGLKKKKGGAEVIE
jgi:hypothetical protein